MAAQEILLLTVALADQLQHYKDRLAACEFEADDKVFACIKQMLQPKLAALVPLIIDDLNKVHEINYAATHTGLTVNAANKGADLFDASGATIEHKHSKLKQVTQRSKTDGTVKKLDSYKCNINYDLPLSAGSTDASERMIKLKESLEKKIDGYAVHEIAGAGNGAQTRYYYLKRAFLLEYLTQYMAKKPKAVRANLGGVVCKTCGEVHRLRDMEQASKKLTEENKSELIRVFIEGKKIVSQC